jgi:AcrR family transcriptional regulator
MVSHPKDPRAIRTKKSLQSACLTLIEEKGFDQISVRDLTIRAGINRSTFYQHYPDKWDLLEQMMDTHLQGMIDTVKPISLSPEKKYIREPNPSFVRIFTYIQEHADFYQTMLGKKGIPLFHHRLVKRVSQTILEEMNKNKQKKSQMLVHQPLVLQYITSAHLGLVIYWLEQGMPYSPHEMAHQMTLLTFCGPINAMALNPKEI